MSTETLIQPHRPSRASTAHQRRLRLSVPRLPLDLLRTTTLAVLLVCVAISVIEPFGWWGLAGAVLLLFLMTGLVLDVSISLMANDNMDDDER